MATLAEIMALKEQSNPYRGLAQLGNTVADIMRSRKEKQAAQTATENQAQAASLLAKASENPEQGQQLFAQAYNLAPKFVSGFVKAQKDLRDGTGGGMTDYQRASLDLRKKEGELKQLSLAQSKEQNDLKKQQLQLKIEAKKNQLEQEKQAVIQNAEKDLGTIDGTLNTVDQLIEHEGLSSAVGTSSLLPTIAGSSASDFEAKLEQLKSQQFLTEITKMKGMGALSESEGKKLGAAAASLELGMSEDAFKKELRYIQDTMQKARNKIAAQLPKKPSKDESKSGGAPQAAIDYLMANPSAKSAFQQKYGYLPEGM